MLRGGVGVWEVGLPVSWGWGGGVEEGQGLWAHGSAKSSTLQVGTDRSPKTPSAPRLGADLQGSEKLAAALDARNVKKQVDGP